MPWSTRPGTALSAAARASGSAISPNCASSTGCRCRCGRRRGRHVRRAQRPDRGRPRRRGRSRAPPAGVPKGRAVVDQLGLVDHHDEPLGHRRHDLLPGVGRRRRLWSGSGHDRPRRRRRWRCRAPPARRASRPSGRATPPARASEPRSPCTRCPGPVLPAPDGPVARSNPVPGQRACRRRRSRRRNGRPVPWRAPDCSWRPASHARAAGLPRLPACAWSDHG